MTSPDNNDDLPPPAYPPVPLGHQEIRQIIADALSDFIGQTRIEQVALAVHTALRKNGIVP